MTPDTETAPDTSYQPPINPPDMIVPPQDKIDGEAPPAPEPIGTADGDPRAPSQLSSETGIAGTETPYRKTPPTNIGSAAEKAATGTPPTGGSVTQAQAVAAATPVNTVAPTISGTLTVGQTLTCAPGTWVPAAGSYTYQWFRGDTPISGATANTRVLAAGDSGSRMRCQVTGIDATNGGSSPASTLQTAVVP